MNQRKAFGDLRPPLWVTGHWSRTQAHIVRHLSAGSAALDEPTGLVVELDQFDDAQAFEYLLVWALQKRGLEPADPLLVPELPPPDNALRLFTFVPPFDIEEVISVEHAINTARFTPNPLAAIAGTGYARTNGSQLHYVDIEKRKIDEMPRDVASVNGVTAEFFDLPAEYRLIAHLAEGSVEGTATISDASNPSGLIFGIHKKRAIQSHGKGDFRMDHWYTRRGRLNDDDGLTINAHIATAKHHTDDGRVVADAVHDNRQYFQIAVMPPFSWGSSEGIVVRFRNLSRVVEEIGLTPSTTIVSPLSSTPVARHRNFRRRKNLSAPTASPEVDAYLQEHLLHLRPAGIPDKPSGLFYTSGLIDVLEEVGVICRTEYWKPSDLATIETPNLLRIPKSHIRQFANSVADISTHADARTLAKKLRQNNPITMSTPTDGVVVVQAVDDEIFRTPTAELCTLPQLMTEGSLDRPVINFQKGLTVDRLLRTPDARHVFRRLWVFAQQDFGIESSPDPHHAVVVISPGEGSDNKVRDALRSLTGEDPPGGIPFEFEFADLHLEFVLAEENPLLSAQYDACLLPESAAFARTKDALLR